MTTQPDHNSQNDTEFTGWFAALNDGLPSFSRELADPMEQRAAAVFLEGTSEPPPSQSPTQISDAQPRQPGMVTKTLIALSALIGTISWFVGQDPALGEPTLGQVLQRTVDAESLKLRITREGETADVWVKQPGQIRWENSPTSYRIAHGSQLWKIDEDANRYQSETNDWIDEEQGRVDLLSLLDLEGETAVRLRDLKPEGEIFERGTRLKRYQLKTRSTRTPYLIEALANSDTGLLESLAVWPNGKRNSAPIAELAFVARNLDVKDEQFQKPRALTEDGRIGKLTDSQGIVTLKPMTATRWTPVCRQLVIKPGDWLRTDVRGANAVTVALTSQYQLILGPGSLVELQSPYKVRVFGGEVNIAGTPQSERPLELLGPKETSVKITPDESKHYQVLAEGQLDVVQQEPVWLAGYKGTSANESLGSLIAKVDGRDVPLTVGYHKVSVEIRDQIARTTIEESFINRTKSTLEGVFHFPLPQDASISGFGMWINGELIEADVVEKQRAREIYETILREKRDPGLLEWSGGNMFKARVYPIPGLSEKRIKIVYTQVLPLRANQYRYSYGLRSELLRKTPVRELAVNVQIHSALPIKKIDCPTHTVRTQATEHSAKIEFFAQEYIPERDFEITCEVDSRKSDVVMIPHQRGEDGYFLVQLTPPGAEGNWQREVIPDGNPLDLLLVCDTSASMDSAMRQHQQEFVTALLSALGPKDQFNLAVCDVDCQWVFDKRMTSDDASLGKVRKYLDDRISLGWTDLDRMTQAVLKRLRPETQVIYIGDGIVSARDANPQEFVTRLNQMTGKKRTGTFHAVSVGSSFESTVLKAISRVGGGSWRQIGGEQTPAQMAFELLNEIAQPGLRNLKVEFRGLSVAAVYPDRLPNLAAGTQQILIGRYLPEGENQTGEIIITGERGGETVKYASRISLKNAEAGNSFIPRLWARGHLDHLLVQGSNQLIKDQIIAMSEEFHIITPYTSLLVLESDADRERFGVKRRYQMRDGERFFADGKTQSNMELLQQQMKRAADWRLELRQQILAQFAKLGRNPKVFQQLLQQFRSSGVHVVNGPMSTSAPMRELSEYYVSGAIGGGGGFGGGAFGAADELDRLIAEPEGAVNQLGLYDVTESDRFFKEREFFDNWSKQSGMKLSEMDFKKDLLGEREEMDFEWGWRNDAFSFGRIASFESDGEYYSRQNVSLGESLFAATDSVYPYDIGLERGKHALPMFSNKRLSLRSTQSINWVWQLLPHLPGTPPATSPSKPQWKGEAFKLSQSLLKPVDWKAGGLEIFRTTETRDPRWDRTTAITKEVQLASKTRWLQFRDYATSPTHVEWCDAKHRGIASRAFGLGQSRKSQPRDLSAFTPGQRAYADRPLHVTYQGYQAEVTRPAENRAVLKLWYRDQTSHTRVTIDTERNVILEMVVLQDDKLASRTSYKDYFQAAGVWWPGTIEISDDKDRVTSRTTQKVSEHSDKKFSERYTAEMANEKTFEIFSVPLPTDREAEQALARGAADFADQFVMLLDACLVQDWDDAFAHHDALEKLAPEKRCLSWIRNAVFLTSRKNEDARQLMQTLADTLVQNTVPDTYYLAGYLLDRTSSIADYNEQLQLLDRLKPVFERQPEHIAAIHSWKYRRANMLRSLGRADEARSLQKDIATAAPWDIAAQTTYANDLVRAGDYEAAYKWLRQEIHRKVERETYEMDQIWNTYAQYLRNQGREDDYVKFVKEWIDRNPSHQTPYRKYLGGLMLANRPKDADQLASDWIKAGLKREKLPTPILAKLEAAVAYALSNRDNVSMNWIDPQWLKPLAETAVFFLDHEHHSAIANTILQNYRFHDSDEYQSVLDEVASRLKASVKTLRSNLLDHYVDWANRANTLTKEDWEGIAKALRDRWLEEKDAAKQTAFTDPLLAVYTSHFPESRELPFRRELITRAEKEKELQQAAWYRHELFDALLTRDWTAEIETEAFALIVELSHKRYSGVNTPNEPQQLAVQISALHRFVDRMIESRQKADMTEFNDQGHPEKLTRTELAQKKAEFLESARKGVADRLAKAKVQSEELSHWITMEHLYLDLKLDRNQKTAAEVCWKMLGDKPPQPEAQQALTEEKVVAAHMTALKRLRQQRAFMVLNYLAVRPNADKALVTRLKDYIAAGLEFEGDDSAPWRKAEFAILVALDEPEELARELTDWIRTDVAPAPWQLALGRLSAERGLITDAIRLFEAVEKDNRLSAKDYAVLADWYLIADRKTDYRKSKVAVFMAMPEYRISNWIRQRRYRWQQTGSEIPDEFDENVIFAFLALFEKSNSPSQYVYELREFYTATREFRLLKMVPEALTGRTPQQIYVFLDRLQSGLLNEVRKESTADEMLAQLETIRATATSAIDLRALDLLEAMIERQASQVLNQPGPHIKAAVAALKRAFEREWATGEVRQMAKFLDDLGTIQQKELNAERLRQLRALQGMTEPGTDDRLLVSWYLAHALFWSHNEKQEGLAVMEIAHREYRQTHPDGWPAQANTPMDGYADLLEAAKRFSEAEDLLTSHMEQPATSSQMFWFLHRRNECYYEAYREDGRVSLGSGEMLSKNFRALLWKQIQDHKNDSHRYRMITRLLSVYGTAKGKKHPYRADLKDFAFNKLPTVLKEQSQNYSNLISQTADTLRELNGLYQGLEFLIERYEDYPATYQYSWQNAWNQLAYRMADWHEDLNGQIGSLEPRLLKILRDELRKDLRTRHSNSRYLYHRHYHSYWSAKEKQFARVAEEILRERQNSGRSVAHIADYFYHGINRETRATEIMLIAYERGILDRPNQIVLCDYLFELDRHAEAIPILQPLVKSDPDVMGYRTYLITAYANAKRPQQLEELLADTDDHFRQGGRWTLSNIAALAQSCLDNGIYQAAVDYYEELIPRYQRTAPNRGIGQGTLSHYYRSQSQAYSALGQTEKAVDAAASGIVAWGPRSDQRSDSLHWLKQALTSAKDLEAFVEKLDQRAKENNQDSPLIRGMIGEVYADRKKPLQAIPQFRLAIDLQPTNVDMYRKLIAAFDAAGQKDQAITQTLALLDVDRHDLPTYKKLTERLAKDEALAERAATTLVEAAPLEAEHHQALAEVRQTQDRWEEAIASWEHVADLRALEPNGLLKLAEAQIHQKQYDEAKATLKKLTKTEWPSRFRNLDSEIRNLQRRIPEER